MRKDSITPNATDRPRDEQPLRVVIDQVVLPGGKGSGTTVWHKDNDPDTLATFPPIDGSNPDRRIQIYDVNFCNCLLPGELVWVRYDDDAGAFVPVGSRGLVREAFSETVVTDGSTGTFILARNDERVTSPDNSDPVQNLDVEVDVYSYDESAVDELRTIVYFLGEQSPSGKIFREGKWKTLKKNSPDSQLCSGGQETSWTDDFEAYTDGQILTSFGYGGGFFVPKAKHIGAGKHIATAVNVPDESFVRRSFQMDYNNHLKMVFEVDFIEKDASFSDCRIGLWMGSPQKIIAAFDWDATTISAIANGEGSATSKVLTIATGDTLKMEVTFSGTDTALIGIETKCFVNGTEELTNSSSNIVKTTLDWCTAYYGVELLSVSGTTTGLVTDNWDFELLSA